ncbi:hypothetical protein NUW58_g1557 [Xylaria curta]|uniref:Uncharacterized protein n=1 Tax=Xylaria curta TaxID=42375 RepID=A0ACC1PJM3_9PEZI|nr:hypothetical protein NUW58_g1557 [Xylaria curta]
MGVKSAGDLYRNYHQPAGLVRRGLYLYMDILHRNQSLLVFAITLALGTLISVALHINNSPDLWAKYTMAQSSFLTNLQVKVTRSPISQPSISVSITNTHSSVPATILQWNSPLDPAALGLGLVHIIPAGTADPININAIKISRKMPPGADSLVTLFPGESATNIVELRDPIVPKDVWDAGPAKVRMTGRWMAVWPELTKENLLSDPQRLQSVGAGVGSLIGEWESDVIEVSS